MKREGRGGVDADGRERKQRGHKEMRKSKEVLVLVLLFVAVMKRRGARLKSGEE